MKLKSIHLKDFRLFYGEHKLDFSQDTNSPITLFIGENGSGKTTLMNAIHWVLTDKCTERLSESDKLVNKDALRENRRECWVKLEIIDDQGRLIEISRSKTADHSHSSLRAHEIKDGNFNSLHVDDATFLSRFFPPTLAQWFIFDGEALGGMNLSGDTRFKAELQQAFGFDSLEVLKSDFSALIKHYEGEESKKKNNARLDELSLLIEQSERFLEISKISLEKIETEYIDKKRLEEAYRKDLTKLTPSSDFQRTKDKADEKIKGLDRRIEEKVVLRANLIGESSYALVLDGALNKLNSVFTIKTQTSSLPSPFQERLIDDIVKSERCICGTPVFEGSSEFDNLQSLLSQASTTVLNQRIQEVRTKLTALQISADKFPSHWEELNKDLFSLIAEQAEERQKSEHAAEQIRKIDVSAVRKTESDRAEAERLRDQALTNKGQINGQIARAEEDLKKYLAERATLLQTLKRDAVIVSKLNKLESLKDYLDSEIHRQEKEVLSVLSDVLSDVINKYLTKNFRVAVKESNYRVDIFDSDGSPAPLSTGEWVLVKLAFVATMVGMAAKRTKVSSVNWISDPVVAPLVLDAPFSVLDSEYRVSTAKNLAEQVQQLVLMTSKDPWAGLMPELQSKIGKTYVIQSFAKGPPKDIEKILEIYGRTYKMNFYECERDESKIIEVSR